RDLNQTAINAASMNQFESAIQYFHQALEYSPDNRVIRSNLFYVQGVQQLRNGDRQGALRYWENALAVEPEFEGARKSMDDLNSQIKREEETKQRIQQIMKDAANDMVS